MKEKLMVAHQSWQIWGGMGHLSVLIWILLFKEENQLQKYHTFINLIFLYGQSEFTIKDKWCKKKKKKKKKTYSCIRKWNNMYALLKIC